MRPSGPRRSGTRTARERPASRGSAHVAEGGVGEVDISSTSRKSPPPKYAEPRAIAALARVVHSERAPSVSQPPSTLDQQDPMTRSVVAVAALVLRLARVSTEAAPVTFDFEPHNGTER